MVTGYKQGDWGRLLAGDYSRPPAVSDAASMDDTLSMGELVEPLGLDSKSLRLFARKVLPAVQAMPTPINPASLGQPRGRAGVTT